MLSLGQTIYAALTKDLHILLLHIEAQVEATTLVLISPAINFSALTFYLRSTRERTPVTHTEQHYCHFMQEE